eukprot:Rhum_TRINITY_DN8972_c1_g1::Rhum_TRINITY_DN8972_c1_g1_i1::g.30493::m.30493
MTSAQTTPSRGGGGGEEAPGSLSFASLTQAGGSGLTSPTAPVPSNTPLVGPNHETKLPEFGDMSFSNVDYSTPANATTSPTADPLSPTPLAPPANTPLAPGPAGGSYFPTHALSPSQFTSPPAAAVCTPGAKAAAAAATSPGVLTPPARDTA